jgi:AcrR family transcriptional regulator
MAQPDHTVSEKARGGSFERMEQAIIAAAGDLFDRKGFNQTSLGDIADAVGVARSTLYHYFDNREQILVAGVEKLTTLRNDLRDSIRAMAPDPLARLNRLMVGLGELVSANPVWIRILMRDEAALPDDTRVRDRESRLGYFELIAATLREGTARGHFRARDEHATALTIVAALSGLQGQLAAARITHVDDTTQLIVDVLLRGVLDDQPRTGPPLERGLDLILEGADLIRRASESHG